VIVLCLGAINDINALLIDEMKRGWRSVSGWLIEFGGHEVDVSIVWIEGVEDL
jgi:hypothetical protein